MLNSSPPTFATQALARHMPTLAAICGHCLGGSVCKAKTAGCVRIDFLQNQTAHLKGFVEMFQDVQRLVTKMKRLIAEKRRPGISVDIDGVTITKNAIRQTVPWTRIKRIAAFRQDIYLGVVVCLAIEIEDGTTVHVIEGDPAWLSST
jgi:hypothetical protein